MPDFVRVGQVTGPFGLAGAVKVYPLTDFEDRFAPGAELFLDGRPHRVEWWKPGHPTVTLKLVGIDNRTLAELHRGLYLEVPAGAVKALAEGSFYHHQLIGLAVFTAAGRQVGTLTGVLERPANDVWVVYPLDPAPGRRWVPIVWIALGLAGLVVQLRAGKPAAGPISASALQRFELTPSRTAVVNGSMSCFNPASRAAIADFCKRSTTGRGARR